MLALTLAATLAAPAAHGQDKKQAADSYRQMCMQAAAMPKPFGEYDLKGNPKLDAYCGCFGEAFADSVLKRIVGAGRPGFRVG